MTLHTPPPWFDPSAYDSAERHEILSNGVPIRYRTGGSGPGPRVLFIHGGRAHAAWWVHQLALFGDACPKWATVDLSGHGDSGWREQYRPSLWLSEVQDVASTLSQREELILVGHSLGGMLSILTAAAGIVPGIRHSISVDAVPLDPGGRGSPTEPSSSASFYRELDAGVDAFAQRSARDHWPEWLARFVGERSLRAQDGGWVWRHDTTSRIIERPVIDDLGALDLSRLTLITGTRSPFRDSILASGFMRRAGEHLRHLTLETGHDVMMERPEEFHALLRAELERAAPAR